VYGKEKCHVNWSAKNHLSKISGSIDEDFGIFLYPLDIPLFSCPEKSSHCDDLTHCSKFSEINNNMRFRVKNILLTGILMMVGSVQGQLRDTSLLTLHSRPFFFNVLKGTDEKIYAGTSEGIYSMEGASFVKMDGRKGYIKLDTKGKLQIDSNGIKYHDQQSFAHLLPFPDIKHQEYHAGTNDFFYITTGGRIYVYEILPYAVKYRNISVRTTSRNFTGTYSGLFYREQPLGKDFAPFTDGHIRELNGLAFVCYNHLEIIQMPEGDQLPVAKIPSPKGFDYNTISDILYSTRYGQYFMATDTKLGAMDKALTGAQTLYTRQEKSGEVVLLGEDRMDILFASGNDLKRYRPGGEITRIGSVPEQILDGHLSRLNYYVLGSQGLYVIRSDGKMEKLMALNKAHTLMNMGNSTFAISTDIGLFLYNSASNKLFELIKGVEFNRRGLYLQGDSLHACSINGMYVLKASDLDELANRHNSADTNRQTSGYLLPLLIGVGMIAAVLAILLVKSRRTLHRIVEEQQQSEQGTLIKEDIENFIRENLNIASLKSISDRFQTKNSTIYALLDPEKPGAFINRLRMEQVVKMRSEQKSAKEISEQTGFSESYVRKVWNLPNA
jgi:type II secretory pathway pseudopilin PulG